MVGCGQCDEEAAEENGHPVTICRRVTDANGVPFGGVRLSSKLLRAADLMSAMPAGERGVVFSFFKSALDLLEAALRARGISVARLDGDDDKEARNRVVDQFQEASGGAQVLLATKTSGGVGLTLTAANHMILLDGWCARAMHQARP